MSCFGVLFPARRTVKASCTLDSFRPQLFIIMPPYLRSRHVPVTVNSPFYWAIDVTAIVNPMAQLWTPRHRLVKRHQCPAFWFSHCELDSCRWKMDYCMYSIGLIRPPSSRGGLYYFSGIKILITWVETLRVSRLASSLNHTTIWSSWQSKRAR